MAQPHPLPPLSPPPTKPSTTTSGLRNAFRHTLRIPSFHPSPAPISKATTARSMFASHSSPEVLAAGRSTTMPVTVIPAKAGVVSRGERGDGGRGFGNGLLNGDSHVDTDSTLNDKLSSFSNSGVEMGQQINQRNESSPIFKLGGVGDLGGLGQPIPEDTLERLSDEQLSSSISSLTSTSLDLNLNLHSLTSALDLGFGTSSVPHSYSNPAGLSITNTTSTPFKISTSAPDLSLSAGTSPLVPPPLSHSLTSSYSPQSTIRATPLGSSGVNGISPSGGVGVYQQDSITNLASSLGNNLIGFNPQGRVGSRSINPGATTALSGVRKRGNVMDLWGRSPSPSPYGVSDTGRMMGKVFAKKAEKGDRIAEDRDGDEMKGKGDDTGLWIVSVGLEPTRNDRKVKWKGGKREVEDNIKWDDRSIVVYANSESNHVDLWK